MAKKTDYTNKKEADLRKEIAKLREDIRAGRMSMNGQGGDVARKEARRAIAQMQTELSARAKAPQA